MKRGRACRPAARKRRCGRCLGSRQLLPLALLGRACLRGFFLNLFNLIPVVPLDGGRAVAALHPAIWLLGLIGLVVLTILRPSPLLPVIILIGGLELWRRWKSRNLPAFAGYYRVTRWQRAAVATAYLGLAALLVVAMNATHIPNSF